MNGIIAIFYEYDYEYSGVTNEVRNMLTELFAEYGEEINLLG